MSSSYLTIAAASTVAFFGLTGTVGAVSAAEGTHHAGPAHARSGISHQVVTGNANRSARTQHRNFAKNHDGDDDFGRHHRRHSGIGFGAITIDLDSIDSSCRYSYRKWQATGSSYWRHRYYDCVG